MADRANGGGLDVGYDIPAEIGMPEEEVQTPCLILDLDALERNIRKLGDFAKAHGVRHRAHGKTHKSVDVAKLQVALGGAVGVCCQKVSEAEVFVRGGIADVLVTNQVRDPAKIDRLAGLPRAGQRVGVCIDDLGNVAELSAAAVRHGTELDGLVEIECGAGRCGVEDVEDAVAIARAIADAPGLRFAGLQAYNGNVQHFEAFSERGQRAEQVADIARSTVEALAEAGLSCEVVTGGGTGSYPFEAASGVFNEIQCGSYAFMDADYGLIRDDNGARVDEGTWENALFVLTSVMSHAKDDRAVVDGGLKVQSMECGLPVVHGRTDVEYVKCSDEHGIVMDPQGQLKINQRLRLVPGHCDPTCNLHDWYVGVRNGRVEVLWPVSARGKAL